MEIFAIYALVLTIIFVVAASATFNVLVEVRRQLKAVFDKLSKTEHSLLEKDAELTALLDRFAERAKEHDKLVETQKLIIENQKTLEKHMTLRKMNPNGAHNGPLSNQA
jgi:hypothetical protein